MKRVFILLAFVGLMAGVALWPSGQSSEAQGTCFNETGFCITNPAFQQYFSLRGGSKSFGFPISREFSFLGFQSQFFQGHIMQLTPDGRVTLMNLLQEGLMPVTAVNGSTFPPNDASMASSAPQVGQPGYAEAIVEFTRANAPNQFNGQNTRFFDTFMNTVDLATAFPGGGGNASLLPLLNLEIWGAPTSRPAADPSNSSFIYQRFQRSIMHYQGSCGCTERILLALWFKTVITGDGLPGDLAGQMGGSAFIRQYSPGSPNALARPGELPGTNMTNAFVPDLGGPGPQPQPQPQPPTGATATPTPSGDPLPTVSMQLSDTRVDPNDSVTVTVIGQDDKGLEYIEWRETSNSALNDNDSSDDDPELHERHRFNCDNQTQCANVWTVTVTVPGDHVLEATARDNAGQLALVSQVTLRVRGGPTPTASPTVTETPQPASSPQARVSSVQMRVPGQ
jgi:hypothetical protein